MANEYDAAIAAGAQVADTAINVASAASANKKQRKWMEEQSNINYQRQQEMWRMNNDFNLQVSDPAFQMQRYKDAGLSPWLVYGKPNTVEASAPDPKMPGQPTRQPINSNFAETMQKYIGIKMAQKQMQNIDAQTQSAQATANNQQASADFTQFTQAKEQSLLPGAQEAQKLANTKTGVETQNLTTMGQKLTAEIASIGAQTGKTQQEITNLQQTYQQGMIITQNLIKQGQYQEAQTKGLQIANQIIDATAQSKIQAENAKNQLIRDTKGMSEKGIQNLPSVLTGQIMKAIEDIGDNRGWWKNKTVKP